MRLCVKGRKKKYKVMREDMEHREKDLMTPLIPRIRSPSRSVLLLPRRVSHELDSSVSLSHESSADQQQQEEEEDDTREKRVVC